MNKCVITITAYFALTLNASPAENEVGRYRLWDNGPPITVIDTVTGRLWIVGGNEQEGYKMRRICYLAENGQLAPTPNGHESTGDLELIDTMCAPER